MNACTIGIRSLPSKVITLGIYKNEDEIQQALAEGNFLITTWASEILKKSLICGYQRATDVVIVIASVGDLGMDAGARYQEICRRAEDLGLTLCPAEVGPLLRLQYVDQPPEEWLLVAMPATIDRSGQSSIFVVEYYRGQLRLDGECVNSDLRTDLDFRFVFLRR
jgi:hypothetical protein